MYILGIKEKHILLVYRREVVVKKNVVFIHNYREGKEGE
jgi:hypothetical protein